MKEDKIKKEKRIGVFVALSDKALLRMANIQHKVFLQWKKAMSVEVKKMRKLFKGGWQTK